MIRTLSEKIKGLTNIIDTYATIGKEDCRNCIHAKNMLKEYQDDLRKTEELQSEEKGAADVVQEIEIGNGNDRSSTRILSTAASEILPPSV